MDESSTVPTDPPVLSSLLFSQTMVSRARVATEMARRRVLPSRNAQQVLMLMCAKNWIDDDDDDRASKREHSRHPRGVAAAAAAAHRIPTQLTTTTTTTTTKMPPRV